MKISKFSTVLLLLGLAFAGLFIIRLLTGEDSWICQNGQWVPHGTPASPKPETLCPGAPTTVESSIVPHIYFANAAKSGDPADCGLVFPVDRQVENNPQPLLRELFAGPTASEKDAGYTSIFSSKTKDILLTYKQVDDTAYVNFKDIRQLISSVSSSCGSAEFLSEIETTLKQDESIKKVIYAINGNPKTFYDWIQIGCDPTLNNCDPKPFVD